MEVQIESIQGLKKNKKKKKKKKKKIENVKKKNENPNKQQTKNYIGGKIEMFFFLTSASTLP